MKRHILIVVTWFLFMLFPSFCYSAPVESKLASSWVNDTGNKLLKALSSQNIENKYATLDKMFGEDVDVQYIARFVIGKYWRTMDKEQQKEYVDLFSRYALSIYKNYPLNFNFNNISFEVVDVKQHKDFTDVSCIIRLPEEVSTEMVDSVNVKFKLTKTNEKIKIVDLIFGESSLLMTYRTRFYDMIKSLDYEMSWFLEDFSDMVISSEKTAQEKLGY